MTAPSAWVAYTWQDDAARAALHGHLRALERAGAVRLVPDPRLDVTASQTGVSGDAAATADLVLVLVSADALASPDLMEREVAPAIARAEAGAARVVPILVRPCDWSRSALGAFQALPAGGRPISSWPDPEAAWAQVSAALTELAGAPESRGRAAVLGRPSSVRSGELLRSPTDDPLSITFAFFEAAGRQVWMSSDEELTVPEPVVLAADPATVTDVAALGRRLAPGRPGYFVFRQTVSAEVTHALDGLRTRGNAVVPLPVGLMAAALADGNAGARLRELETLWRTQGNLFVFHNSLIEQRFLFGRQDLLTRLGAALAAGEHSLVTGLRKSGKTSLLNILRQHLAAHPVAWIGLEAYDRLHEDWPPTMFAELVRAFDDWGRHEFRDWPGQPETPATATALAEALGRRRRWQRERGRDEKLVVVLDELERVLPRPGEAEAAARFVRAAGALRLLGQSSGDRAVALIGADLRPDANRVNLLGDAGTNPFFHFFHEVPLPLLDAGAVRDLVTSAASLVRLEEVEPGFVERLFADAGGHAYLTRLVAGAAYEACRRRGGPERLTAADYDAGLRHLEDRDELGSFFEQNLWGLLTGAERDALRDAAGGLRAGVRRLLGRRAPAAERAFLRTHGLVDAEGRAPIRLLAEWVRRR